MLILFAVLAGILALEVIHLRELDVEQRGTYSAAGHYVILIGKVSNTGYEVLDPADVSYVNYINSRDFSAAVAADDSPEGLKSVSASESPTKNALLLAACEVGGTVTVYELNRR